jgi:hypothetical protein
MSDTTPAVTGNKFKRGDRVRVSEPMHGTEPNPWHGQAGKVVDVPGDPLTSDGQVYGHRTSYTVLLDGHSHPTAPHDEHGLEQLGATKAPVTFTVLDLSTAHLPETYCETGPGVEIGVTVYDLDGYGWLMWVPKDPDEHSRNYHDEDEDEGIPEAILTVQRYARALGCDYVRFDRDGDVNADLPTWDW